MQGISQRWLVALGVALCLLFGVGSYHSRSPVVTECLKQPIVPVVVTREASSVTLKNMENSQVLPMPVCAEGIEKYQRIGLVDLSLPHLLRSSDFCRLNRTFVSFHIFLFTSCALERKL